ncbi:hypothetical protein Q8F55_007227 [Vanrija albida]|uniref:Major facilitator superfamily (MFS) profile domain-containing protein n=1 Tax=Vanrija albida TaxID=181172 RepID=A0ABR3PZQ9_9TREE
MATEKAPIDRVESTRSIDPKAQLQTRDVQGDAAFHKAVNEAPLDPWSKTAFKLYGVLFIAALNATASGFDGSIFSSINAMDQWRSYLHLPELSSSTGLILMIYTVGAIIGSLFTGPICDQWGRRAGMQVGAVLIMVGAAILTAVQNENMCIGGRFVLGWGVALGTSAAPTYALELAPPHWRARIVGFYNTFFYAGSILSTGVAYASAKLKGEVAFRLPLGLQLAPPAIILVGTLFIPESPRWLCWKGKQEDAARILAEYHGGGDMQHPVVQLELAEFEASIELQKSVKWWDYSALYKDHNARWRFLMVTFMSYFAQLSGNSVLTYYLPAMYSLLGITSTERRLLLTFANSIVSCAGAVAGSATNDRMGRRTRLWVGSFVLASLLSIVTAISSQFATPELKARATSTLSNAGVAFIFLFGAAYSFTYTPLTATYCAEALKTEGRAKGMGVHVIQSNSANLYNTYVTQIAFRHIGWKYYLVFVALNVVYGFVWYFFGVETRGRTLEQLEAVFDAPFPPRASLQKTTMVQRDGHLEGLEDA